MQFDIFGSDILDLVSKKKQKIRHSFFLLLWQGRWESLLGIHRV